MPHATNQFPFESKILAWTKIISDSMTDDPHRAFLLTFDENGWNGDTFFSDGRSFPAGRLESLRVFNKCWFSYEPSGAPAHYVISWKNVQRETVERIMNAEFDEEDFVSQRTGARIEFPQKWSVVF